LVPAAQGPGSGFLGGVGQEGERARASTAAA